MIGRELINFTELFEWLYSNERKSQLKDIARLFTQELPQLEWEKL